MSERNPAIAVAKDVRESREITLPDGVRVRIVPVSAALIEAVVSKIKDPPVPVIHDDEKGVDIQNPGSPEYLAELTSVSRARSAASVDAMLLFGIEISEETPIPPEGKWLKRLAYLEKLGHLDLSRFDLKDEVDVEFLYKRYIVANAEVLTAITSVSGVSEEEIAEAETSFRSEA